MATRTHRKPAQSRTKPIRRMFLTRRTFGLTFAYAVLLVISIAACLAVRPQIGEIAYRFDGKQSGTGSNPLFVKSEGEYLYMRLSLLLPIGQPTTFKIKPDDCIETLMINDREVNPDIAKYCDYTKYGRALDLSSYLKTGENTFVFRLKDTGGKAGLRIAPHYTTPPFILLNLSPLLLTFLYMLALLWPIYKKSSSHPLWIIGIGGALLRIFYFLVTPYSARGNDIQAHLDYVTHVASHWSIPPASDGWEFHQAPLFYFLSAVWMKLGQWLQFEKEALARIIQFESLIFSLGTLVLGVWIGTLLFPRKQKQERLLFACLVASFPSLIFHSVSITNNSLYIFFVFLLIVLLIQWWKRPTLRSWYLLILCLALTFITRVSALVFVPVLGFSLLFHNKISWRQKCSQALFSTILLLLLIGWLPFVRFVVEKNPTNSLTFSSQTMNSKLAVPTDARTFLIFNPIRILQSPYAEPWKETSSREFFWEYFFRSAFFGEFSYADELRAVAVLILACSLALLLFLVYGLVKLTLYHSHEVFPLGITVIFVLAAHFFYRIYAPFSANQDFRFSLAILPLLAFYVVAGIREGPQALRPVGIYLIYALFSLTTIFLFFLGFFSS
ncbi:hypothetical protein AUJ46_01005 [Candidatus Peregrinibacteria bacterium CG1_02_54_53]|nr:MAG: hypothetical protein AUJ46_01005 [Candidatus Peregrinibacteria bacterium CG1_02_54_53]